MDMFVSERTHTVSYLLSLPLQ